MRSRLTCLERVAKARGSVAMNWKLTSAFPLNPDPSVIPCIDDQCTFWTICISKGHGRPLEWTFMSFERPTKLLVSLVDGKVASALLETERLFQQDKVSTSNSSHTEQYVRTACSDTGAATERATGMHSTR